MKSNSAYFFYTFQQVLPLLCFVLGALFMVWINWLRK